MTPRFSTINQDSEHTVNPAVHWESRYASGHTFYRHNPVRITIDIGATGNMIRLSTVRKLKITIF